MHKRMEVEQEPSTLVPEPAPLHRLNGTGNSVTVQPDSLLKSKIRSRVVRSVCARMYPNFKSPPAPDYFPSRSHEQQSQFAAPAKQKAAASPQPALLGASLLRLARGPAHGPARGQSAPAAVFGLRRRYFVAQKPPGPANPHAGFPRRVWPAAQMESQGGPLNLLSRPLA